MAEDLALGDEDLAVVEQAIHGGAGHQRVVEDRRPLLGASYATELSGEKREW